MFKTIALRHPYWTYYLIAVAFSSFLFLLYLPGIEYWGHVRYGDDYSSLGRFRELQQGLIDRFPALFHHSDSWVLYVSTYCLFPLGFPMFFMPAAPTAAAMIVVAGARGRAALLALLRLYKPIQGALTAGEGLRIYAALLGGIALMVMAVCLREWWFGEPERVVMYLQHLGVMQWDLFLLTWLMGLLFNQGGALEELGWRGYALPLLVRKFGSPFRATLLLGLCWALWHFPREIWPLVGGAQSLSQLLSAQFWFILMCLGMSVCATYFVNITGGSVIPAIMIHGAFNQIGGMFNAARVGMRTELGPDAALMWLAAALVVIWVAGFDLGWQRRRQLLGAEDPSDHWVDEPARL